MKNVHILPTDNYSPLVYSTSKYGGLFLSKYYSPMKNMGDSYQNIYITSDEEIKEGDYMFDVSEMTVYECIGQGVSGYKIILTTDQDLDGVQPIDDEFLEWFVKNPSCEEVEVQCRYNFYVGKDLTHYKIIIPKQEQKQHLIDMMRGDEELGLYEEPKQETLEEAAERIAMTKDWDFESSEGNGYYDYVEGFTEGAKWMQERMYSEEEVREAFRQGQDNMDYSEMYGWSSKLTEQEWFENIKKKTL
jgi:hypothetical protein